MVFTDSPKGEYKDGVDNGIVSPKFDLTDMRSAILSFDAKLKAEQWDFLWVEATSNGGEDYQHLQVVRPSENRDWAGYKMDLSAFDGKKDVQQRRGRRRFPGQHQGGECKDLRRPSSNTGQQVEFPG